MATHKTMLDGPELKLDFTCAIEGLSVDTPVVIEIVKAARALHSVAPLGKVKLTKHGAGVQEFDYEFTALDGRTFKQILKIDSIDPLMNFDVTDMWRVSEFIAHRAVRDLLVGIVITYQLEKFALDWNHQ